MKPLRSNPLVLRLLLGALCLLSAACTFAPAPATLSERAPVVATNPADGRVAAATRVAAGADRVVVSGPDGSELYRRELPVDVTALCWTSRGELLAFGYRLQRYSFGGNLIQTLYRLSATATEAIPLADVTIRPSTAARFVDDYARLLQVAFAPMGDELVFVRLHDPPALPGYLQLVHRSWQAERERELVRLPLADVQLTWQHDDVLTVATAADGVQSLALWASPLTLRAEASGSGLPAARPVAYDDRQWTLRRWRYLGLITPEEFLRLIEREAP